MRTLKTTIMTLLIILGFSCQERVLADVVETKITKETSETIVNGEKVPSTRTVNIHKTGFLSNKRIKITYSVPDGVILSVFENGKEIPESKYHKYEDYVSESFEYEAMTDIQPEYNLVVDLVDDPNTGPEEKLRALEKVLKELDTLESANASIQKSHLEILKGVVETDLLKEKVLEIVQEEGYSKIKKIKNIEFKKGTVSVNNTKLSEKASSRIFEIYEVMRGFDIEEKETVEIIFD